MKCSSMTCRKLAAQLYTLLLSIYACQFVILAMQCSCVLVWYGIQDPVDASPAVLVKRYNITQHKELEMQLSTRQGDLLR